MSMHLTKDEFALIIQKSPQRLSTNRLLHYEKCSNCRDLYKQQIAVHKTLLNIKPLKAPVSVLNNVMRSVGALSSKTPNKNTDWVFLFALVTLFAIGAWFIFSGGLGESLVQYVPQIIPDIEITGKTYEIIKSFKESLKSVNFTFHFFKVNGHSLYLFFGALSFLFYMFWDKKFGRNYKFK